LDACRNAAISSGAAARALSIELGAQTGTLSDVNGQIGPQIGVATDLLRGCKAVCFERTRRPPIDVEDENLKPACYVRSLRWFGGYAPNNSSSGKPGRRIKIRSDQAARHFEKS
jgi:hypothetical protein